MLNAFQLSLMPLSFAFLFFFMLLYWGQAAFFSRTKYKKLTQFVFWSCFAELSLLLVLRWVESGHFPLSNLFESLLFLSWSFLLGLTICESSINPKFAKSNFWADFSELGKGETRTKGESELTFTSNISFPEQTNQAFLADENESVPLLGVIISPLAFISYAFAFLYLPKEMQKATSLVPALQSNWLMMHVTVMICSYAALMCGSILSMAFLVLNSTQYGGALYKLFARADFENHAIKKKAFRELLFQSVEEKETTSCNTSPNFVYESSPFSPSPSGPGRARPGPSQSKQDHYINKDLAHLAFKLDNLSYRMCGLGFPLLTIGIISGAVWANSAWGSYWSWDPKETWALITWLVFAVYLHARIAKGWRGKGAATIATVGFFVVWFCYLGVNIWAQGLHSYGWLSP